MDRGQRKTPCPGEIITQVTQAGDGLGWGVRVVSGGVRGTVQVGGAGVD